ncbi:MAG TPA: hypothetical protein VJ643_04055, partial [Nitrososphaera sp.]|nr:hypothetical protein [Nitrososphaera sp.]
TKAIAAIPMVGAIVTAALLLSGLSLIGGYQPAIAQQNMTGGGGATTGGNATTTGGNATTAGLNQTTASEVILHLEEVRTALEGDDTETALMHLDLALTELGANTTTTAGGATAEGEEGGDEGEEGEEGGGG